MNDCETLREQWMDQWQKHRRPDLAPTLQLHLAECASCRGFMLSLTEIGAQLDRMGEWADEGIQVPGSAFFEEMVTETTWRKSVIPARKRGELPAFAGLGALILGGAGLAVYSGFLLPVVIVSALVGMQSPVLILLRDRADETKGVGR